MVIPSTYRVDPVEALWTEVSEIPSGAFSGWGVFTTFRMDPGKPVFALPRHFQRLRKDCAAFGLFCPWPDAKAFADWLTQLLSHHPEAVQTCVIRLTLISLDTVLDTPQDQAAQTHLFVNFRPIPEPPSTGTALKIVRFDRLFPQCKHISQGAEAVWLRQSWQAGFDDFLRVSQAGWLTEAAYANIFLLRPDGSLLTPRPETSGCLAGTMRQAVLTLASHRGWHVTEDDFPESIVESVCGGFLTNAVRGVWPIRQIDARPFDIQGCETLLQEIRAGLQEASSLS